MRRLPLFLFLFFSVALSGQVPDSEAIGRDIFNKDSRYYYPPLFERYISGDTTLTSDDYRYIYYGYVFDPGYEPFRQSTAEREMMWFQSLESPDSADFRTILKFLNGNITKDPFNIPYLNFMTYAYGAVGDKDNEYRCYRRVKMLVETITSSGSGTKLKSAWQVIHINHIEDVTAYLGIKYEKPSLETAEVMYLPLYGRYNGARGLYFDFGRMYLRPPDQSQIKKGWEFNGVKIR